MALIPDASRDIAAACKFRPITKPTTSPFILWQFFILLLFAIAPRCKTSEKFWRVNHEANPGLCGKFECRLLHSWHTQTVIRLVRKLDFGRRT